MKRLPSIIAVAAFTVLAEPSTALNLRIGPTVVYEGQPVVAAVGVNGNSCQQTVVVEGVVVTAEAVVVTYSLKQETHGCFLPTPMGFAAMLGRFSPGRYAVRIEQRIDGTSVVTDESAFDVHLLPATVPFAKLEIVGGDRQIMAGIGPKPLLADVEVRATDVNGQPVVGASLVVESPGRVDGAVNVDEFGYGAFGDWGQAWMNLLPIDPAQVFVTDSNGVAHARVSPLAGFPASFVVGAGASPAPGRAPQAFAHGVWLSSPPLGAPVVAVEFHHAALGRYFLAVTDDEIAALDRGAFAGWKRSIGAFAVWPTRDAAPPARGGAPTDAVPVCRFFSALYGAHFFTSNPVECDGLEARWPGIWALESREAFWVMPPDGATGLCLGSTMPVYRLFRVQSGPAHRFVTGTRLRDAMVQAGWIEEGPGGDRGAMCVPA
jgi:hypothetical protein